jgi:hypothetical protein
MKPLLIFFVLLFLGAMFLIGENPEYNPFNSEKELSETAQTLDEHIKASNEHQGEE